MEEYLQDFRGNILNCNKKRTSRQWETEQGYDETVHKGHDKIGQ